MDPILNSHAHSAAALEPDKRKLAQCLADLIEAELRENRWEPGHVIGTIADLVERYRVGRSSIRQAVLLLERQGRLELKRGLGGGVAVGMSGGAAAAMSMATFFEFLPVEPGELFDVRACIEGFSGPACGRARRSRECLRSSSGR